ncbi:MAG: hypothetical protein EYC70_05920 [Planctomycetota bacterium]|nr:MAG: hypothetical protein EYC70_05920 [Planctomycetota bacterium]
MPAERETWRQGLRMAHPPSPERIEAEKAELAALDQLPPRARARGYLRHLGPGFLQSALTLGAGTASTSLFAGAVFGYELLWVAPVAMLLGIVMFSAVAHQTLSTGLRPLEAMRRHAGAPFAWAWAVGALLASVIWHVPQYSLAAAALADMSDVAGLPALPPLAWSGAVLAWAVLLSLLYGTSAAAVRGYERALKYMVWAVVLSFGLVVAKTGVSDWGALLRGFFTFRIPGERNGVLGAVVALSGLSAAVGVNMLFLYPYSLLARGWGREHRRLARYDLLFGMFVPYVLATSLMIVATANALHLHGSFDAASLKPMDAAQALGAVAGPVAGRVIFDLGLLGMTLSTITLHMLVCGFVGSELFGWPVGSWRYRLVSLLPAPAFLAPLFWSRIAVWVAVPANILCGLFLPVAYLGFLRLQRSRAYLGPDRPAGARGGLWFGAMLLTTLLFVAWLSWFVATQGLEFLRGAPS